MKGSTTERTCHLPFGRIQNCRIMIHFSGRVCVVNTRVQNVILKVMVNQTSGCMLYEVEWGAHESSLFLYLDQIDHDGQPHESSLFVYQELIDHDGEPQDSSAEDYGKDYYKENFPPNNYGLDHPKETYPT